LIIEAKTYRYSGHSASDPGKSYRNEKEIQEYRHNYDPIKLLEKVILEANFATED